MADYISSYSGTQIDSLLGQIKNEGQIQNMIDSSITNAANVTSTTISLSNGATISLWRSGKICQCEINSVPTSAKEAWVTIGTLPAAFCPHWNVFMKNSYPGRSDGIFFSNDCNISTATAIPANIQLWFFATWIAKN